MGFFSGFKSGSKAFSEAKWFGSESGAVTEGMEKFGYALGRMGAAVPLKIAAGLALLGGFVGVVSSTRSNAARESRDALRDMGDRSLDTQLALNDAIAMQNQQTLMGQPLVLNGEHGSRVLAARGGSRAIDTTPPTLSITDEPIQSLRG